MTLPCTRYGERQMIGVSRLNRKGDACGENHAGQTIPGAGPLGR
jgi:hypothetical protein